MYYHRVLDAEGIVENKIDKNLCLYRTYILVGGLGHKQCR